MTAVTDATTSRPSIPGDTDGPGDRWAIPAGHASRFARRSVPAEAKAAAKQAGAPPAPDGGQRLQLADGVELLGASEGAGYINEHHLARTKTGRVVQLTDLLFLVAQAAGKDGTTDVEAAAVVSEKYGKTVTADNVRTLADKLRPLGILAAADGSQPEVSEPDPLLALRLRSTLLGRDGVRRLTVPLRPLFFLPVVVVTMAALVAMDLWLFLVHGLAQGVRETLGHPTLFLLAFGLVVFSAAFHECGHATGCTVGGGRPGRMGAGIYLAWPAFYTDVTDVYRLNRKARLRTDLGGVYFSCLLVLGLGAVYAGTRFEPLLLIAFLMQIEVVHQMLPFLRLDGYYVVSDLVGVPDLFRRTGPVLKSMIPGAGPQPAVLELKPWVRNVVRIWVLVVLPVLALNLGMILLNFPQLLSTAWDSGAKLVGELSHAGAVTLTLDIIQLIFLIIPLVGLLYTFFRLATQLITKGWTASAGSIGKRAAFVSAGVAAVGLLTYLWWPDARYTPYRPGQTGTLQSQGAALSEVGYGHPLFRSPAQAQQPLPPLPAPLAHALGTTSAPPAPPSGTGASPTPGPTTGSAPAPTSAPVGGQAPSSSASQAPVRSTAPTTAASGSQSPTSSAPASQSAPSSPSAVPTATTSP